MRKTNLIKNTIFISTLIILIFLCLTNQKQYTKLKILIWNTPSLTLGTYLAISTGSGYIFSYIMTANIIGFNQIKQENKIKYKVENQKVMNNTEQDLTNEYVYNNTLIERDINDPSPTINASFRVIGHVNKKVEKPIDNYNNENYNSDSAYDSDNKQYDKDIGYEYDNKNNNFLNDWDDDSYLNW